MSTKKPLTEEQIKAAAEANAKKEADKVAKAEQKKIDDAAKASEEDSAELAPLLFDPKKLTAGSGTGFWKYNEDPKLVKRETFQQQRAKDFGIKPNDVVFVALDGVVKTFGV